MTVMVDTDVLIDVFAIRQPHYPASDAFLGAVFRGDVLGVLAGHGLANVYYLLRRLVSLRAAELAVDNLLLHLDVIGLDRSGWLKARALPMSDYEDAGVAVTAEIVGASWIVTRNLSDFQHSPVPAITPTDFVARCVLAP